MSSRRDFLKTLSATAVLPAMAGAEETPPDAGKFPVRPLGRTGIDVTTFCLGGHHVARTRDEPTAEAVIRTALEQGVRFFDNARNYTKGRAEELYGKYLVPKHRDEIILMTKSTGKTKDDANRDLEASLKAMNTDHLDLWQIHSIGSPEDVDTRINGGVFDAFFEAKAAGKTRFIGFTGHSSQAAHLHMLAELEKRGLELDTCQMPINLVDPHYDSFIVNVLPVLVKRRYGILAMKTLVFGRLLGEGPAPLRKDGPPPSLLKAGVSLSDMFHYICSLPVTSLVSGCETPEQVVENTRIIREFKGMDAAARDALVAKAEACSGAAMEYYKRKI
jgi:aryl-alcohol dehydrogenase-like predicted oxidoreductase